MMPSNSNRRRNGSKWIAAGCVLVCLALVLVAGSFIYATTHIGEAFWGQFGHWDPQTEPWVECGFDLPDGKGRVVLLRHNAHPFLAEYNRKIRLEITDRTPVTLGLPMNVGGSTMINVYLGSAQLSGKMEVSVMRLDDHWGTYIIDVDNLRLLDGESILRLLEGTYLGRWDGRKGPLRFVPADEGVEEAIDKVGY